MFEILVNDILPVFSVLVLGFVLGKQNVVSRDEASTLNRIAFLVLQPPLIFLLGVFGLLGGDERIHAGTSSAVHDASPRRSDPDSTMRQRRPPRFSIRASVPSRPQA